MSYIQGFVTAVPTDDKAAYLEVVRQIWEVFKSFGAISTVEGWGDDIRDGALTVLKMAVKAKPEETVVFSWILWPDKATCQAAEQKMMADERMKAITLPFDGKRMIYGGFATIYDSAE